MFSIIAVLVYISHETIGRTKFNSSWRCTRGTRSEGNAALPCFPNWVLICFYDDVINIKIMFFEMRSIQLISTCDETPSEFYCPKGLLRRDPSNFRVRLSVVCLMSVCLMSVCHTQFRSGNPPKPLGGVSVRVQKQVRLGHLTYYRRNPKYRRKTCKWYWR